MTIANDLLILALRNGGINGVGQTPQPDDVNDSFRVLNAMINEWEWERTIQVNRTPLPTFPDLTTDVPFWTAFEHVLLVSMAVRLRQVYALPPVQVDVAIAASALKAFSALNLQYTPASTVADDDGTGYGICYLALRMAGRVNDTQGVATTSQDMTDAGSLLNEMLDEWNRERAVRVIPGTLPTIPNLATAVTLTTGQRSAIVLNLAVRLRDAVGAETPKQLLDRAEKAYQLVQSINQQQIAPLHPGVPAKCIQVIFLALRMAGRITDQQSVSDSSKDVNDAFSLLVMMLGQWQRKRWIAFNEVETSLVSTGANFYTIGPGGDFNVPRPDRLHAARITIGNSGAFGVLPEQLPFPLGASARTPNLVNIPLTIIASHEDWNKVTIPDLKSIPSAVFYDSSFPIGRVYFYPVAPANTYELHLVIKASLPVYATVNEPLDVPPDYLDAIVNNLACRILVASGQPISPFLLGDARASLETIKMANSQIPLLSMPAALVGHRGGDVSSWAGAGLNQAWTVGGPSVLL